MMKIILNCALATLIALLFLVSSLTGQSCQQNASHPGYKILLQNIGTETIEREYVLRIPTNYDPALSSPLLINMHGFGGCAADYAETVGGFYEFDALADQEGIIVAYPQGAYRPDKQDHYWEPGDNSDEDIYKNDSYFIEQLIESIAAEYNVDRNRIYAAGYSNGGMMAYSLACNRNESFAGIGIMSGVMLEEECNQDYSIPIILFHGIADDVLPYEGNIWYRSTQEIVDFWLDKNSIPATSLISTELKNGQVIRDEYSGGNENTCLTFYTINEEWDKPGDHVWFSEAIDGSTPNQIMWEFFSDNCGNSVSTKEIENEEVLHIYPNPFSDHITLESDHLNNSYKIYNSHGVLIKSSALLQTHNVIDLSDLTPAVYLIQVSGNIYKLVKTR